MQDIPVTVAPILAQAIFSIIFSLTLVIPPAALIRYAIIKRPLSSSISFIIYIILFSVSLVVSNIIAKTFDLGNVSGGGGIICCIIVVYILSHGRKEYMRPEKSIIYAAYAKMNYFVSSGSRQIMLKSEKQEAAQTAIKQYVMCRCYCMFYAKPTTELESKKQPLIEKARDSFGVPDAEIIIDRAVENMKQFKLTEIDPLYLADKSAANCNSLLKKYVEKLCNELSIGYDDYAVDDFKNCMEI